MEELLKLVPEENRGAFQEAAKGYIKADDDTLIEAVKSRQNVFDKITAGPMDSRLNNWKEKELPKMIEAEREKIRKELNPEETAAEKVAREFKEYKEGIEAEKQMLQRKDDLRSKYQGHSDLAAKLSSLEDSSVSAIMEEIIKRDQEIEALKDAAKFGAGAPPASGGANVSSEETELLKQYNALMAQGNGTAAMKVWAQIQQERSKPKK